MVNLLKSEFLKYRNRALLVVLVHVALMAFLNVIVVDINAVPVFNLWLLASMIASAGFGILQMNAHKRINHWIYLLQRPLAPWKIATSLVTAGGLLVLLAIVFPFVLNLASKQFSAAAGIELRHYLQLMQIIPAVLVAYAYGCFLGLYTHRFKFIGLTVFFALMNNTVGGNLYLGLLLLGIITVVCLYLWFKPDLDKGATHPVFIVLSELPLHSGMFWVALNLHTMLLTIAWALNHGGPIAAPVRDSVLELRSKEPRDIMLAALEDATLGNAEFYRQQIRLGEVLVASAGFAGTYPERNQRPSLDNKLVLVDPETDAIWRFSHTQMLFKGVDRNSDALLGWLGPQGFITELRPESLRFASVPWVTDNRFILDFQTIYQLDWEQKAWREKFSLAGLERDGAVEGPERFHDSMVMHEDFVTLFSDRNLYLFRSRQLNDLDEPLVMEGRVPLPVPAIIPRSRVYVMDLIDGYLVGVLTAATLDIIEGDYVSLDSGGLYLYETRAGVNRLLNGRALTSGVGASLAYRGIVIAPGFKLLNDVARGALHNAGKEETWSFLYHRFPRSVLLLAFCSMLVSGVVVNRLLKPVNLPRVAKRAWVAIAAFSGVIGLASFYLGTYRKSLRMQTHGERMQGELLSGTQAGHG